MIYINLNKVEPKHFPDGTQMLLDFKVYIADNRSYGTDIYWQYENDEECMTLFFLVNHIREYDPEAKITLSMPYIPNARMDRTKSSKEVFTLKYFCKFINSLGFNKITVLDPHSDVGVALLDRVEVRTGWLEKLLEYAINHASEDCDDNDFMVYFPDAGAMKRYQDLKPFKRIPLIYGQKQRDWKTGEILGLKVMNQDGEKLTNQFVADTETAGLDGVGGGFMDEQKPLEGKTVLMVDDIISYGGTMYYSALKLKELGASHIYAYATHTENSVLDDEKGKFIKCLRDGTVEKLYTTSSIYMSNNSKIEVIG